MSFPSSSGGRRIFPLEEFAYPHAGRERLSLVTVEPLGSLPAIRLELSNDLPSWTNRVIPTNVRAHLDTTRNLWIRAAAVVISEYVVFVTCVSIEAQT